MRKVRFAALGVTFAGLTALGAFAGAQTLTIYHSGSDEPVTVALSSEPGEEMTIAADGSVVAYTPDSIVTTPPKDPPTCINTSRNLQQGDSYTFGWASLCTDPENTLDAGSAEIVDNPNPAKGLIGAVTPLGAVTYTANADATGSDSFTYRVADLEGTYSNIATVSITINEGSVDPGPGPDPDPDDPDPIPVSCSDPNVGSLSASTRSGVRDNVAWDNTILPWIDGDDFNLTRLHVLGRNRYSAQAFDTGDFPENGTVYGEIVLEDGLGTNSSRMMSLSECPGDFTYNMPTACRFPRRPDEPSIVSAGLFWQIGGSPRNAGHCVLEANKTYYLNVVHAVNTNYPSLSCSSSTCGYALKVRRTQ